jgi:ribosomal protein S18 acetylase RimI-like enzyme
MEIRRLVASEASAFHALRLRALLESPESFGATYEQTVLLTPEEIQNRCPTGKEDFVIGAFDDQGELLGMVRFNRSTGPKSRHKGTITAMFVAPEARGKGIGRAMLEALLREAAALPGLERINLEVVSVNEAARSLYLARGFRIYGKELRSQKVGDTYFDVEAMVLELE